MFTPCVPSSSQLLSNFKQVISLILIKNFQEHPVSSASQDEVEDETATCRVLFSLESITRQCKPVTHMYGRVSPTAASILLPLTSGFPVIYEDIWLSASATPSQLEILRVGLDVWHPTLSQHPASSLLEQFLKACYFHCLHSSFLTYKVGDKSLSLTRSSALQLVKHTDSTAIANKCVTQIRKRPRRLSDRFY